MTDSSISSPAVTRRKGRSPSYPGIALDQAIERARQLYNAEGPHWTPITAVAADWGYKSSNTGPFSVAYAALKKFGLLEDEGSGGDRQARLTRLGREVVLAPEPLPHIQEAALTPDIHRDLWAQYGTVLPSDRNLLYTLHMDRGFTQSGAEDFLRQYKVTVRFARLEELPRSAEPTSRSEEEMEETREHAAPDPESEPAVDTSGSVSTPVPLETTTRIPLPLLDGSTVVLEGDFPVTAEAWRQFMGLLSVLEPSIVTASPEDHLR